MTETKSEEMNWPFKGQAICIKCHVELLLSAETKKSIEQVI